MIGLMMIDHEFHRKGLGTLLLKHCEHVLFETYNELKLESWEQNSKANSFYKKNGWIEGRIRDMRFWVVFGDWVEKKREKINFFCFFGVKLGENDYNSCAPHL